MYDDVTAKVYEIIAKYLDIPVNMISNDLELAHLIMDELSLMGTIYDLEDEFEVEIPEAKKVEDREDQFRTVGNVIELILLLVQQKNAA